jgi:hypothetical protein
MNINLIYADALLVIPNVQDVEINQHILTALSRINGRGLKAIKSVVIANVSGAGTDPLARPYPLVGNYYPDAKCLILPDGVKYVESLWYKKTGETSFTEVFNTAIDYYFDGTMKTNECHITDNFECYLGFEAAVGDTFSVYGQYSGYSIHALSTKWKDYVVFAVLAGLFSHQYQEKTMYQYYKELAEQEFDRVMFDTAAYIPLPNSSYLKEAR